MWRLSINEIADALEMERLSGIFEDPVVRMERAREELFTRLGVGAAPLLTQVGDGYPCPWNVLANLENAVLFSQDDFREFAKAPLQVPNATAGILMQLRKVCDNTYQTMSWLQLLHQMMRFPVSSVRMVWQAALYHFPTAAPLACVYVRLEMAALGKKGHLDGCRAEADAKDVYKDHLRLLNTFYRHLPLAFSCELYALFFAFVTEYIQPDSTSLDLLYRTCLRRDVGVLPQSTTLWMQYLSWRSATIRDHTRRREWRKRLFRRILSIPLVGLDAVKEEYDVFVATEFRGRVLPDEKSEVEKRFARAKTEADDLSRLMYFFYPSEWEPASGAVTFPYTLYLARPLVVDGPEDPNSIKDVVLSRIEMDLWTSWYTLLQRIRRPLFPGSGGDVLHYSRCRSFMTMMAAYFPHQPTLWMELIDFCVHQQPLLSEKERFSSVAAAMEMTLLFQRRDICVRLFVAQTFMADFAAAELAFRDMKESLLYLRSWLLHYVRSDDVAHTTAAAAAAQRHEVLEKLQHITVVAVNFMRMGNVQGEAHLRLVARFVMHQVDFLSLTTAALRKLLKANQITAPAEYLRPFHLFCSQWIALELIRGRAAGTALLILQQWCEHLKMMLRSGRSKSWTCEQCGVDELVLDAFANVLTADPSITTSAAVDAALAQLEEAANAEGLQPSSFPYLARQLRHRFFLPCPPPPADDVSDVLLTSKLLLPRAAPHRYDTVQFRCPLPRTSASDVLISESAARAAEEAPRAALVETAVEDARDTEGSGDEDDLEDKPETFPEESLWSSAVSFRNSSTAGRPRFDRQRRPGPYPNRFQEAADAAARELPRVPAAGPSRLAVVSQAFQLPALLDCLASTGGSGGGGRGAGSSEGEAGKAVTKLPPLNQLEEFLIALPSVYEYDPEVEEGGKDVSTDWVLKTLLSCEALS